MDGSYLGKARTEKLVYFVKSLQMESMQSDNSPKLYEIVGGVPIW